jgi:uncharacterized protein YqfA (UPF0365 family)
MVQLTFLLFLKSRAPATPQTPIINHPHTAGRRLQCEDGVVKRRGQEEVVSTIEQEEWWRTIMENLHDVKKRVTEKILQKNLCLLFSVLA